MNKFARLDKYLSPVLMLIVAAGLAIEPALWPFEERVLPSFIPYGLAIVGMIMAWRFQHSSAVFALCVLTLGYFALVELGGKTPGRDALGQVFYAGAAILLPVNLAVLAFLEERGLFSRWGLMRAGLILVQVGALYWLTFEAGKEAQGQAGWLFHFRLFPPEMDRWTHLPQPALITNALAFFALIAGLFLKRARSSMGFIAALAASAAGFHLIGDVFARDVFMTASLAIIALLVLQGSYHMAFIDELTSIPGRRALLTDMKQLGARYVIAMADVDHFKKFNDKYGHDVGDQVLRMVANRLSKVNGGKAYRYGGEEFTILFSGTDVETTLKNLVDVCLLVEQSSFRLRAQDRPKKKPKEKTATSDGKLVSVTVSIGAASPQSAGDKPQEIMKSADKALYKAKKAGRNRVVY